jgi:hypothetical protein
MNNGKDPPTLRQYHELLAKLEAVRTSLVGAARDELASSPQSELLNSYIESAHELIERSIKDRLPEDGGMAALVGLGPKVAKTVTTPPPRPLCRGTTTT